MKNRKRIDRFYNELEEFKKANKRTFKDFPLKERAREFHMTENRYIEFFTLLEGLQVETLLNMFQDKFLYVVTDVLNKNIYLEKGFPLTFYELGRKYKNYKEAISIISEIYDNDLYRCVKRIEALIPKELKKYFELYLKHIALIQDKENKLIYKELQEEVIDLSIINELPKEDILYDDDVDFDIYENNLSNLYDNNLDEISKPNNEKYDLFDIEDINKDDDFNDGGLEL